MVLPIPTEEADSDAETVPGDPTLVHKPVEEEEDCVTGEEDEEEDNETDSETFDPDALYIDEAQWSYLTAEHKLCSNTASFSAPGFLDSVPAVFAPLNQRLSMQAMADILTYMLNRTTRFRTGRTQRISQTLKKCIPD